MLFINRFSLLWHLIKIENIVINTSYIAAVRLERPALEKEAFILLATPKFPLLQLATYPIPYHYEWLDFTGREAMALQDYFSI